MKQDFSELLQYLDEKFTEVNSKVDSLAVSMNTLQQSVDGLSKDKQVKTDEILILNHRVKSTEDWIDKASPQIGIKFEH